MHADLAPHRIDRLAIAEHRRFLQVDDAVLPEGADHRAGFGVELDELKADRDVQHTLVTPVGPVGDAASGQLPGSGRTARAFSLGMRPHQLAGRRVQRDRRATGSAGRVQNALRHHRRPFELVFRPRPQGIGLEAPGHFELAEVRPVDLIEGRIVRAGEIAGIGRPLAVRRRRESGLLRARLLQPQDAPASQQQRDQQWAMRLQSFRVHGPSPIS